MQTRNIHLLITGNEQLSGKRQDRHFPKLIDLLRVRGLTLTQVTFLGDEEARIAGAIGFAVQQGDVLLCCGGIGATPDDRTRQAAATAFNVPIARHPEAEALIVAQYGERAYPHRVLMADFPRGAALIPNPVNRVAGFSMGDCHFVPGFPEMAWPMLEWVLDTHYQSLFDTSAKGDYRLRALGSAAESDLLDLMEVVLAAHPGLEFASLPCRARDDQAAHIEFGFKGPQAMAASAYRQFEVALLARGVPVMAIIAPEG
jgi:molybdopterin-biosynthesis enzyme MoeA-like protein